MEEHGIGDPASIREIISEVDADNVSLVTLKSFQKLSNLS